VACAVARSSTSSATDAYNPTQTSQVTNQLVLQDEIFAMMGGLGTPTHTAVVEFLNESEVPDLFVASGSVLWKEAETNPYTFGWQPNYTVEGKVLGQYIAENFPDAKVGLFGQGDDFGEDGFEGAKQFLGDQVVAEEFYTPGNTDVAPQITALQAAGADLVVAFSVPAYTALSQLASLRLNFKPQWVYSNVGSDATLVGALLNNFSQGAVADGGSLLEGAFTTAYIPTVEQTDDPWTQQFSTIWDEQGGGGELSNFRVYGMAQAYTLTSALVRICDNLNREALVAVLEEEGSTFEGPWLAPFDYSAESHRGISGLKVVQLEGGAPVDRGPILVTDDGEGELEESTGGSGEVPPNGIPDRLARPARHVRWRSSPRGRPPPARPGEGVDRSRLAASARRGGDSRHTPACRNRSLHVPDHRQHPRRVRRAARRPHRRRAGRPADDVRPALGHTKQYAAVLREKGIGPGDKVALLLPNTPHFPLAYFGTLALGAVAVPVHALLKAEEIQYVLEDSGAKVLICAAPLLGEGAKGAEMAGVPVLAVMDGGDATLERIDAAALQAQPIDAIVPREPDDTAVILYTSGTTGTPKGAEITHLNVMMNVLSSATYSFDIGAEDVVLGCLPLFHTFGQTCCMNTAFFVGAASCCCPASTARRRSSCW
jgi:ABC-type branched-subunit amino acid transport system substrate-binding protein